VIRHVHKIDHRPEYGPIRSLADGGRSHGSHFPLDQMGRDLQPGQSVGYELSEPRGETPPTPRRGHDRKE
jgi:hypothetical protein